MIDQRFWVKSGVNPLCVSCAYVIDIVYLEWSLIINVHGFFECFYSNSAYYLPLVDDASQFMYEKIHLLFYKCLRSLLFWLWKKMFNDSFFLSFIDEDMNHKIYVHIF